MYLMRIIGTHPQVVQQMEEAARKDNWAKFRAYMGEISVTTGILCDPFAIVCTVKHHLTPIYADFMICMAVGFSGTPWTANLSAHSDQHRVGNHSVSWCFTMQAHKNMVQEGLNVDVLCEKA